MVSGSRPHLPHVLISRLVLMYYLAWDVLLQGIIWLKAHCFQLLYLLLYAILQAMSIRCDWSNLASNIYGCSASQCYNQKMSHNKFSSLSSSFSNHHHLSVPSLHSTKNHYNQKRISKQLFGINDAQLHQKTQIFLVIIRLDNFARGQIQV